MFSGRWNAWGVATTIALFAGGFVAAREFLTSGTADIMGVLLTCVVGFVGGFLIATVRNWYVSGT
jgi:hypothetical protein